MEDKINLRLPSFFYNDEDDETKKDKGQETLQDFFLKWTMHCAEDRFRNIDSKIQHYARNMLFSLIYGYNDINGKYCLDKKICDSFIITKVSTWYQWKDIDIIAEIEIEEDNLSKKFVLNIENKYYTIIRDNQLEKYSSCIKDEYWGRDFEIINLVIFADDCIISTNQTQLQKCKVNNYKLLCLNDIQKLSGMEDGQRTENALFDEFWF